MQSCIYGTELSQLQQILESCHVSLRNLWGNMKMVRTNEQCVENGITWPVRQAMDELIKNEKVLCDIFIQAVRNLDGNKVMEIASGIWFLKNAWQTQSNLDVERGLLLWIKPVLINNNKKWTILEVAKFLARGKKVRMSADGFSSLRRKCKELDFPLAESGKSKRK